MFRRVARGGKRRAVGGRRRRYVPRRRRYAKRPSQGFLKLNRKLPKIVTYASTGAAGVLSLNDPTGNCLSLGTPVLITGSSSIYDVPFSMKFRLDQLINSADLTNIADRYKINSVKVKVHVNNANMSFAGNSAGGQPWIEYIQDHDDATLPTASFMREKMGVRNKYFSGARYAVTMGVVPRVADEVYSNGITTAYAVNRPRQWINCAYPGVEHYGLKGILHNVPLIGTTNGNIIIDWDVTEFVTVADIQ